MFNQVINGSVRNETLDGTEYAVAPITLLKPMNLNVPSNWGVNEAYLPAEQAKESIPSWNGTPLTLNHPSAANGNGTTANSPEIHEKSVLGRVFNADWNDGTVDAEAWFDIEKVRNMGGDAEKALENVLNGESVEVSTGYRASKLPQGEYDGETRTAVQGNLKPDHVAVLPNSKGKCSIEAGCGVGESVANSLIVTNAEIENQLSEARTPEFDGTETSSWGEVSKDLESWADALDVDAESVADMSQEQKDTVANHTLLGDPSADSWQELSYFPVVNPNNQNLNRGALMAVLSGRGSQADIPEETLESARNVAQSLLEDEFDEDMSENSGLRGVYNALKSMFESDSDESAESDTGPTENTNEMSDFENEDMIEELADNTDFDRENLEAWDGTDCLANLYENHMTTEETEEETTENDDKIVFDSQEEFEEAVESVVSNRQEQSEKEQIASEIASNSDEYDDPEGVLEDFPTVAALNTKKKDVLGAEPDFSAGVGANAKPATNEEDASDLKMFGSDA